jgi:hypothetical protein
MLRNATIATTLVLFLGLASAANGDRASYKLELARRAESIRMINERAMVSRAPYDRRTRDKLDQLARSRYKKGAATLNFCLQTRSNLMSLYYGPGGPPRRGSSNYRTQD